MTVLPTIAILGAGSMGGAILAGLLAPGVTVEGGIRVTNRTEAKAAALRSDAADRADASPDERDPTRLASLSLETDPSANLVAVADARIVIVGVKPAMVAALLAEIAPSLAADAIVVSVAAGVTTAAMEAIVPGAVVRAMPNTPSMVGRGVTGVSAGSRSTPSEVALATAVFSTVGSVIDVPEDRIDALSTISGSGPAYVYFLIEQLTSAAIGYGFSEGESRMMVEQTFLGASELLAASGETPAEMRRRVTSPNGTTERAIGVLQEAGIAAVFERATGAALARARELAAG